MKKEIPWNLIIQKLKHDITAEEEHDLTVWLAEDNHRVIFEELQTLWQDDRKMLLITLPIQIIIGKNYRNE